MGYPFATLQWKEYTYQDKAREVKRLAAQEPAAVAKRKQEIDELKAARQAKRTENAAWSQQNSRQEERERRKEKRSRKREAIKKTRAGTTAAASGAAAAAVSSIRTSRNPGKGGEKGTSGDNNDDCSEDDWDELAREERMAKKVKRGLVDKTTFEKAFGLDGL
jgi:ATP-dependent RNA helicase DDX55/SPB4